MSPSEYAELVEFLGRQFAATDQRFAAIDGRFARIDGRFDVIDRSIAELRGEMLGHFDEIYRRLERLEQEYHAITQRYAG